MKNTIIALLIMLVSMPVFGRPDVKNSLTIRNNTGETIQVALCWFHREEQGWRSLGWLTVEPYKELRTDLSELEAFGSNTMYVYAHSESGKNKWTGNSEFRIDTNAFNIAYAEKIKPKILTAKFQSVQVGKGNTMFFIEPK